MFSDSRQRISPEHQSKDDPDRIVYEKISAAEMEGDEDLAKWAKDHDQSSEIPEEQREDGALYVRVPPELLH